MTLLCTCEQIMALCPRRKTINDMNLISRRPIVALVCSEAMSTQVISQNCAALKEKCRRKDQASPAKQ